MTMSSWVVGLWLVVLIVWAVGMWRNQQYIKRLQLEIEARKRRIKEIEEEIVRYRRELDEDKQKLKDSLYRDVRKIMQGEHE